MQASAFLKSPSKHKAAPFTVVFGSERFLKRAALDSLIAGLIGTADGADSPVQRFTGTNAEYSAVMDAVRTVSMWSPVQVVVLDEADDFVSEHRGQLEKFAEKPARGGVLILDLKSFPSNTRLAKKVAETGLVIDCSPPRPAEAPGWAIEWAESRHGKKLERSAAALLVELAGVDLGMLDQELAKLAAYVGKSNTIDAEAVRGLVGGWKAETTWKMLDAVRDGQLSTALHLLDKLLAAGEHPLKLLGGVNYSWRAYAAAARSAVAGMPLQQALESAGVKPFAIAAAMSYLRRVGRHQALQFSRRLLQADLEIKGRGSGIPDRAVLERLLVQLAGNAS
jgi:DNA polymerase-3 subunit delta